MCERWRDGVGDGDGLRETAVMRWKRTESGGETEGQTAVNERKVGEGEWERGRGRGDGER